MIQHSTPQISILFPGPFALRFLLFAHISQQPAEPIRISPFDFPNLDSLPLAAPPASRQTIRRNDSFAQAAVYQCNAKTVIDKCQSVNISSSNLHADEEHISLSTPQAPLPISAFRFLPRHSYGRSRTPISAFTFTLYLMPDCTNIDNSLAAPYVPQRDRNRPINGRVEHARQ